MKNIDKIERLKIVLESKALEVNLELQQRIDELSQEIEVRDVIIKRDEELEEISDSNDIDIIDDIEEDVADYTSLDTRYLTLEEVVELDSLIRKYKKEKNTLNLFAEIKKEIEKTDDKKIYAYDCVLSCYEELKYDEEYYFILSKLNIIVKNGQLLYMCDDIHTYDSLLHLLFKKDDCIIVRKNNDMYDIRRENYDYIEIDKLKEDVKNMKKELDEIEVDGVVDDMKNMIDEKAKEVEDLLSEAEEIANMSLDEMMREKGDDSDEN